MAPSARNTVFRAFPGYGNVTHMAKHVHHYKPPPPPPPPSAPAVKPDLLAELLQLAGGAVLVVGIITLAAPWVHQVRHPLPPAGWVCWSIDRTTAAGTQHGSRCEPAAGWHVEHWPGGEQVAVPDVAAPVRRYPVRD